MADEKYIVWDTPLCFGKSIGLVYLLDDGKLTIVIQDNRDNFRRVKITFDYVAIYRNIEEMYRSSDTMNSTKSWTVLIENSKWLSELRAKEDLIDELLPEIKHYQIITEFDVIDILSDAEPNVEEIEAGSEYVGEAPVYYLPEDRKQVDQALEKYKKPNK